MAHEVAVFAIGVTNKGKVCIISPYARPDNLVCHVLMVTIGVSENGTFAEMFVEKHPFAISTITDAAEIDAVVRAAEREHFYLAPHAKTCATKHRGKNPCTCALKHMFVFSELNYSSKTYEVNVEYTTETPREETKKSEKAREETKKSGKARADKRVILKTSVTGLEATGHDVGPSTLPDDYGMEDLRTTQEAVFENLSGNYNMSLDITSSVKKYIKTVKRALKEPLRKVLKKAKILEA